MLATVISRRSRPAWPWPTPASRRSAWTTATRRIDGAKVWFCSDEHITFVPAATARGRGRRPRPAVTRPRRPDRRLPRAPMLVRRRRRASTSGRSTCAAGEPAAPRRSAVRQPASEPSSASCLSRRQAAARRLGRGQRKARPRWRDGVLLVGGHLGEGAAVAVVGHEHRVVAEARRAPAARRRCCPRRRPRPRPPGRRASATRATVRNRAVRWPGRGATPLERREQLGHVVGVGGVLAGVAGRAHARARRRARRPRGRCRRPPRPARWPRRWPPP